MIGPVSGTGRAMMASLQQAMAKGMPADQAVQYVKSMATQGVAPLADLYAMMNQFQRLKQPQAQPPQTPPTIRDQLNMIDQQQQMQGGIGGMQAPAPQPSPMDRGLGAIDAGRMEYPQFAGGGVVALSGGGVGDSSTDLESELNQLEEALAADDYIKSGLGGSLGRAVQTSTMPLGYAQRQKMEARLNQLRNAKSYEAKSGPSTRGRYRPEGTSTTPAVTPSQSPVPPAVSPFANTPEGFGQMLAEAKKNVPQDMAPAPTAPAMAAPRGRGGQDRYAELLKGVEGRKFEEIADKFSPEEEKRISKALSGLGAEKQDAVRMALAQAGFRMAAAASRGGRERTSFLGAAAEGAMGGMQQYAAVQKELRQTERELGKEMADLRKYQDQVARGERTAKRDFEEKKQRDILDLETKREQMRQFNAQLGQQLQIAGMQYGGEDSAGAARIKSLDVGILNAQLENAQDDLNNLRAMPPAGIKVGTPEHAKLLQDAQNRVKNLNRQLSGLLSSAGGVPTTGGAGPYSKMPKDQFEALFRKEFGI
jgi:hypothetical protein